MSNKQLAMSFDMLPEKDRQAANAFAPLAWARRLKWRLG